MFRQEPRNGGGSLFAGCGGGLAML
jgi:hypothetical protein